MDLDRRVIKIGASSLRVSSALGGDPAVKLLADPDLLFSRPDCEVIKDQKKIKVGRVRLEVGGKPARIYLKRYNVFSWPHRLASLFLPSRASRSWAGAAILLREGFHTGRPVAAVECRSWGMLTKSFYLSEEIPEARTADALWLEELKPLEGAEGFYRRRGFLRSLARLFRSLHDANIYHDDLKDANILVGRRDDGQEKFFLLDLEGIRKCRHLSRRRQAKNLMQLNRTLGRYLSATERLSFLKAYLGPGFSDRATRRRWIQDVLDLSRRWDRRSLRRIRSGA